MLGWGDDVTHITLLSNFSHHPRWLLLWTTRSYCNTSSIPHALCVLENPAPSVWCSVCFLFSLKTPTHPWKFYSHFAAKSSSTVSSAEVGTPCCDPTTASLYTTQYFSLSQTVLVLGSYILPDTAGRHHQAHITPSNNVYYVFSLTSNCTCVCHHWIRECWKWDSKGAIITRSSSSSHLTPKGNDVLKSHS